MCAKNNTRIYVARTSNNRVIMACDLYCCLLPQCEALRTCRLGFRSQQKWCCDQEGRARSSLHKKNVRSGRFVVKRRGCCCYLSVGVALNVRFTTNGMCAKNNTHIHAAPTSNRVILAYDLYCCLLPQSGPDLSRFDRFFLIGPHAKGGPAPRVLTNTNLHFLSKLLVYSAGVGPSVFKVF